jgi:sphinganine-1-phosphate aldolase
VYHGGQELVDIAAEASKRYALSNPLHPDVFPMLRKMESEVVAMCCAAFHGGQDACGSMTSGGTESILMAVKTYRDLARATRGVREPELIAPVTAHAAFDKACAYFCIRLVHIPVDPVTFRATPAAYAAAITPNTIALVASAVSYPQGVLDPIPDIAALALGKGLPLHVVRVSGCGARGRPMCSLLTLTPSPPPPTHTPPLAPRAQDCCLGSLLICHAAEAGFPLPHAFDFAVPGVTSISMDTHKYGFSPKGSSVVMYATRALRQHQYFVAPEWTGGIYASPSIAGSRPGSVIAATWATLMSMGRRGYVDAARAILGAAATVTAGVAALGDSPASQLCLYGRPDLSVVAFGPKRGASLNIYNVNDAMSAKGWNLNVMQNPACMHLCVTFANAGRAAEFVADLAAAEQDVRTAPPGKYRDGSGAIYGLAASIPDKSLVGTVCHAFLDTLTQVPA